MKRRVVLAGAAIVLGVAFAKFLSGPEPSQPLTASEVAEIIASERAARRAERQALGLPFGPGTEPNDWSFIQRAYPRARIDFEQLTEAAAQAQAMRAAARRKPGTVPTWIEEGPDNIGGRVSDLEFHPTDSNVIFAGMASGGVFKSTDGGSTWTPIFDDQPVLTIGDIAIDPTNPDVIYVGTGEPNAHSFSWFGMGVFKTTDGGQTWSHLGLEETRYISRIVIDPNDTSRLYVAATGVLFGTNPDRGIYRSTNGGSTWDPVLFVTDSTAAIDVAINPSDADTVYAAMWERVRGLTYRTSFGPSTGIYRSVDGADTWEELTNGLPSGSLGRPGIAVAPSNPDVVYVSYDVPSGSPDVYRSTDGGDSFAQTNDGALNGNYSSFGWYFGQIRVSADDPDEVFVLGVPLYRSQDGGSSWANVSHIQHVDHHAMAFDPNDPDRIFGGNDGGIYVSTNSGSIWTKLYDQPTNQFYAIEVDFLNPSRLYGGTQDNGTLRTPTGGTTDWERIFGGDGFYTLVDPTNSSTIFVEYQYGNLYKSTDDADTFNSALNGVDNDRRNWSTPVVLDPSNPETMYYGTYRVWKTTDAASSWTDISNDLTNGNQGANFGTITTIAVAPSDSNSILVGTDDSNVWLTQTGGMIWAHVSANLPNRWVTQVAFDPTDAAIAYVTFSGLRWDEEIANVYRTADAGTTWADISANLPDAPVNGFLVDPDFPYTLYVASDVGVFWSTNTGASWDALGDGLPAVSTYDLKLHSPTRILYAGTHGRSIYSLDLSAATDVVRRDVPAPMHVTLNAAPNPFNPATTIRYSLAQAGRVSLAVFDLAGRQIRSLESRYLTAGDYETTWNGRSDGGSQVASGTYFLRLETAGGVTTKKLTLVR